MIRFVDDAASQGEFLALCGGSAFGCKLAAIARAYGFQRDFARFWLGESAAYCLLDSALSVVGDPGDPSEARMFLDAVGARQIFGPEHFVQKLGLSPAAGGPVLAKRVAPGPVAAFPEPPKLQEVYQLLRRVGMDVRFEPFYLDLSHRIRHGAAFALGEYRDGRLAGCGVVSAVASGEALLSAVAVEPEFRHQGIGSELVTRAEAALPGRTLYLMREENSSQEFYAQLSYSQAGRWAQAAG